ncbi:MAG: hypothetical protein AAF950_03330 [Pseudomonadota bacterium]
MFTALQDLSTSLAVLLLGMAIGAGWICTMAAPNAFFDDLGGQSANAQVRRLLLAGSTPIAGMLLGGAAASILTGAYVAGALALVAACGFFSNRWILASLKTGDTKAGTQRQKSSQRAVAVGLSMVFLLVAVISVVLLLFGV